MSQSSEIQKIFKSRVIILELLEKQGYDTSKYTGSNITEVNSMYLSKQMDMLLLDLVKMTWVNMFKNLKMIVKWPNQNMLFGVETNKKVIL